MRPNTRLLLLGALPIMALPFGWSVRPVVVLGESMRPTFHNGQVLLMHRWHQGMPLHRGDIVVFRHEGAVCIKRILAMPGEDLPRLRFQGGTFLLMDDVPDNLAPCIDKMRARGRIVRDDFRVPQGFVYTVGDNRSRSCDSRDFGPIPIEEVFGVIPQDRVSGPGLLARVP